MLRHKDFTVILIRLLLGYIFLSAGLCKLTHGHFGQIIGPPLLEDTLAKYGLGLFARIVAITQVVCGILLLSHRFSTVGAIMLLPMNLSILAVTISMHWVGTPYVNGFFIALNIALLLYDWHKLKVLINPAWASAIKPTALDAHNQNIFNIAGIFFAVAALVASRFSVAFTNVFAITAFAAMGYSVIQVKAINKMQALIVALVMLNMIIITLASLLGTVAQKLVLFNTLVIFALFAASFIKLPKRKILPVAQ